jgi:hypothetical protein
MKKGSLQPLFFNCSYKGLPSDNNKRYPVRRFGAILVVGRCFFLEDVFSKTDHYVNRGLYKLSMLLSLLLSTGGDLQAQDVQAQRDFGAWMGIQLKKELPKDVEWSLEQQVRTWQNSMRLDQYFVELGLQYKINKNFSLRGNLRYIHDTNQRQHPENAFRYNLDVQFKIAPRKKWHLYYRARYQQRFSYAKRAFGPRIVSVTRHRIKTQVKFKKHHKLYAGVELFVRTAPLQTTYLDQLRFSLGDKIKTKLGVLDVGAGYEVNLQPQEPFAFFFVKAIYKLSL